MSEGAELTGLASGHRFDRTATIVLATACAGLTALLAGAFGVAVAAAIVVGFLAFVVVQSIAVGLLEGRRAFIDRLAATLLGAAVVVAIIPLIAVLAYTVSKGIGALSPSFFTHSLKGVGPLDAAGGAYHAILGTVEQVLIASVISVPVALLVAVSLVEYEDTRLAGAVRFVMDVMLGIPSIVAGLFVFSFWVIGLGFGFSGLAAAISLSVLMVPIVVRSSEEMLRLVPQELREASYALGVARWRTVLSVVIPTAAAGITTGVVLAVARVAGEAAPLLLTAFGFSAINANPFHGPQSSLPLFIFSQATSAFTVAVQRAWAGALTLIAIVLILTVVARLMTTRNKLASAIL